MHRYDSTNTLTKPLTTHRLMMIMLNALALATCLPIIAGGGSASTSTDTVSWSTTARSQDENTFTFDFTTTYGEDGKATALSYIIQYSADNSQSSAYEFSCVDEGCQSDFSAFEKTLNEGQTNETKIYLASGSIEIKISSDGQTGYCFGDFEYYPHKRYFDIGDRAYVKGTMASYATQKSQ